MTEFNLSNNIEDVHDHDKKHKDIMTSMIPTKKVKEFIRLAKNNNCKCGKCIEWRKRIDKLAGDKLKCLIKNLN